MRPKPPSDIPKRIKEVLNHVQSDYAAKTQEYREQIKLFISDLERKFIEDRELSLSVGLVLLAVLTLGSLISLIIEGDFVTVLSSLVVGVVAMACDAVLEIRGVSQRRWEYHTSGKTVRGVPFRLIFFFFLGGFLLSYVSVYLDIMVKEGEGFFRFWDVISLPSLFYMVIGLILIALFLVNRVQTVIFWMLPLSLGFLSFLEGFERYHWIFMVALIVMLLDYLFERFLLTKYSYIYYEGLSDKLSEYVALSYFPMAVLFQSLSILVHTKIVGFFG